MRFLAGHRMVHGDIRPELVSVPVRRSDNFRLVDRLASASSPVALQTQHLRHARALYMSPALYAGLAGGSKQLRHNPFKSDTFSLGLVVLEAGLLDSAQSIYSARLGRVDEAKMAGLVQRFLGRYSRDSVLCEAVLLMLEFAESLRPTPAELLETIRRMRREGADSPAGPEERHKVTQLRFTDSGYEVVGLSISQSNFYRVEVGSGDADVEGESAERPVGQSPLDSIHEESASETRSQARPDAGPPRVGHAPDSPSTQSELLQSDAPERAQSQRSSGVSTGPPEKSDITLSDAGQWVNCKESSPKRQPDSSARSGERETTSLPELEQDSPRAEANSTDSPRTSEDAEQSEFFESDRVFEYWPDKRPVADKQLHEDAMFFSNNRVKSGKRDFLDTSKNTFRFSSDGDGNADSERMLGTYTQTLPADPCRGEEPPAEPGSKNLDLRVMSGTSDQNLELSADADAHESPGARVQSNFTYARPQFPGSRGSDTMRSSWADPETPFGGAAVNELMHFDARSGSFKTRRTETEAETETETETEADSRPSGAHQRRLIVTKAPTVSTGDSQSAPRKRYFTTGTARLRVRPRIGAENLYDTANSGRGFRRQGKTVTIIRNGQKITQGVITKKPSSPGT